MREDLIPLLACPSCGGDSLALEAESRLDTDVHSGSILCRCCAARYPVEQGIARMLPAHLASDFSTSAAATETVDPKELVQGEEAEEAARKRSEMRARDEQAGDYDRMWYLNLFGLAEIPATLRHLRLKPEHLLLEAGCGTGRMTREFARRTSRMVSVDYSWESLRACASKLRAAGIAHVDLLQADICRLPFRPAVFDRAVSCQVLEHIPTPQSREAAVCDLARVLKPGGNLALSAYQYSLLMRLFGQKEGEHRGGIYFYRFTRPEIRALLSRAFRVESMTGALVYHYLARCTRLPEGERTPVEA